MSPGQVAEHQPEPYMDEIFHVPQARAYCAGAGLTVQVQGCCTLPCLAVCALLYPAVPCYVCPAVPCCAPALWFTSHPGNYTQWDPKITTLPGLYLFTVG